MADLRTSECSTPGCHVKTSNDVCTHCVTTTLARCETEGCMSMTKNPVCYPCENAALKVEIEKLSMESRIRGDILMDFYYFTTGECASSFDAKEKAHLKVKEIAKENRAAALARCGHEDTERGED